MEFTDTAIEQILLITGIIEVSLEKL